MNMEKLYAIDRAELEAAKQHDVSKSEDFAQRREAFLGEVEERYHDSEQKQSVIKGVEQAIRRGIHNREVERFINIVGVEEVNRMVMDILKSSADERGAIMMDNGEEVQVYDNPIHQDRDTQSYMMNYHLVGSNKGQVAYIASFLGHVSAKPRR